MVFAGIDLQLTGKQFYNVDWPLIRGSVRVDALRLADDAAKLLAFFVGEQNKAYVDALNSRGVQTRNRIVTEKGLEVTCCIARTMVRRE